QPLKTEPVTVTVRSVLRDANDPTLNDARPPLAIITDDYRPAWYAGITAALLLMALIFFLVRRREAVEEVVVPTRPAHLVALEKLHALEKSGLLDSGEFMIFYVRLSEAVREYLGRRYGFPGVELTTTEIVEHLRDVQWPTGLTLAEITRWLDYCDLVKFSGYMPPPERGRRSLKKAFEFVHLTRPAEIATEDETPQKEAS
ncbi:MAG: hypothetical protein ACNA8W_20505, partial [Bradymonadaceae bacterium]